MAPPSSGLRFGTVRLLVEDFGVSWRFYTEVLGLRHRPVYGEPPYGELFVGDREVLALFDREAMEAALGLPIQTPKKGTTGSFALTLEVPNLAQAAGRLKQRKVRFVAGPTDRPEWGLRTLHFQDPDGNLVELFQRPRKRPRGADASDDA